MRKLLRTLISLALAAAMVLTLAPALALGTEEPDVETMEVEALDTEAMDAEELDTEEPDVEAMDAEELDVEELDTEALGAETADWTMLLYLCGSDLESEIGSATNDLVEILKSTIMADARNSNRGIFDVADIDIYIFTGGAEEWDPYGVGASFNDEVENRFDSGAGDAPYIKPSENYNQLFKIVFDEDARMGKMELLWTAEQYLDMGDPETAITFLELSDVTAALTSSEHIMLEFWDHGLEIGGAELDEKTDNWMALDELQQVAKRAYELRGGEKLDLIAFDACLMSTFEVGYTFREYADYLLASEEIEPVAGWSYDRSLPQLSAILENSGELTAEDIGKAFVDGYAYSLNGAGDWAQSESETLALTDLSRMDDLKTAIDAFADAFAGAIIEDGVDGLEPDQLAVYTAVARAAEAAQTSYEPGHAMMIDLYDFMYRVKSIDGLEDVAADVIDVLGTPPGADPGDYVGPTAGRDPAVLYRGTGKTYDNSIGLSIYYPNSNAVGTARSASRVAVIYEDAGITGPYADFIDFATESTPIFRGELNAVVTEDHMHSVSVKEDLDLLKKMEYQITYSEWDEDEGETGTYLLGSEMLTEGWEDGTFTVSPRDKWFTLGDELITVQTKNYQIDGSSIEYTYSLSAYVNIIQGYDPEGNPKIKDEAMGMVTATWSSDSDNDWLKITDVTVVVQDENGTLAMRSPEPQEVVSIFPTRKKYGSATLDYSDKAVKVEERDGDYYLPVEMKEIISGATTTYAAWFVGTDLYNNPFESNLLEYRIVNDFEDLKIGFIPPQAYTGAAVRPTVRLLYQGLASFEAGTDYMVSYNSNVEKGTATVTVTSLIDDLPGTLTGEFTICDKEDLAEECLKLLPDHDFLIGCEEDDDAYEYIEHAYILEMVKYFYEYGAKLSADGLAKLDDQYTIYENVVGTLKDNGVELIGAFTACGADAIAGGGLTLRVENKTPGSGNAQKAYVRVSSEMVPAGCYYVGLYEEDDPSEEATMLAGASVTLKMPVPSGISTSGLKIYSLTDQSDRPVPIEYSVVERNGGKYVVFDTGSLGYFVLCTPKTGSDTGSSGGSGSGSDPTYSITVPSRITGGTVKISPTSASEGQRVTITVKPDAGYELDRLTVTDSKGGTLALTDQGGGKYTFVMPNFKVSINMSFKAAAPSVPVASIKFTDVQSSAYYYDAVNWAVGQGITSGTTANTFSPDAPCTRAQIVSFLWRAAGSPKMSGTNPFLDVSTADYYYDAVLWAVANGITAGSTDNTFSPNSACTRAQAMTFLYRTKNSPTVSAANSFTDLASGAYYTDAVQWAVTNGVTAGTTPTTFSPDQDCTRAQIMSFLYRDRAN